jgi:hypothetical protein
MTESLYDAGFSAVCPRCDGTVLGFCILYVDARHGRLTQLQLSILKRALCVFATGDRVVQYVQFEPVEDEERGVPLRRVRTGQKRL